MTLHGDQSLHCSQANRVLNISSSPSSLRVSATQRSTPAKCTSDQFFHIRLSLSEAHSASVRRCEYNLNPPEPKLGRGPIRLMGCSKHSTKMISTSFLLGKIHWDDRRSVTDDPHSIFLEPRATEPRQQSAFSAHNILFLLVYPVNYKNESVD